MKKFIPIFSIAVSSFLMLSCTSRDEDLKIDDLLFEIAGETFMMKVDSAKNSEAIVDPDPPVRDGDNWRLVPNK